MKKAEYIRMLIEDNATAAELIAERLGAKYERASVRYANKSAVKRLEDFL